MFTNNYPVMLLLGLLLLVMNPALSQQEGQQGAGQSGPVVFLRGADLWISDSLGQGQRKLAALDFLGDSGGNIPVGLSPDGNWVAVGGIRPDKKGDPGRILLIATRDGSTKTLEVKGSPFALFPSFSPDGKSLVVMGAFGVPDNAEGNPVLLSLGLVDIATGKAGFLNWTEGASGYYLPAFSPDGKQIVYVEAYDKESGLSLVVIDLSAQPLFNAPLKGEARPQFNQEGTRILLAKGETMLMVDLSSGKEKGIGQGNFPTFVDGGAAVVFERSRREGKQRFSDLWRLDLRPGAVPQLIVKNGGRPSGPAWGPVASKGSHSP